MADTTFTAQTTKILAAWLNDVNAQTYKNAVNVKMPRYGAVGDGTTDDTTAVQAAVNTGKPVYFPPGTYKITTAITFNTIGQKFFGAAMELSIISVSGAINGFKYSGSGLMRCFFSDLSITGNSATLNAIDFSTSTNLYESKFSNLTLYCGGKGIYAPLEFSTSLENVNVSSYNSNGIELSGSNATTLTNCYVHTIAAGKYGYRIYGQCTLIGCNGLDSGQYWGCFGQSTVKGDSVNTLYALTMIGCNVEDFQKWGVELRYNGTAIFDNVSWLPPAVATIATYDTCLYVEYCDKLITVTGGKVSGKGAVRNKLADVYFDAGNGYISFGNGDLITADIAATLHSVPYITVRNPSLAIIAAQFNNLLAQQGTATSVGLPVTATANANTTAVGNVGGGEDDLMSYAMAANSFSASKKGVVIDVYGSATNNANAKTLKLYFGSVAMVSQALTVNQVGKWHIRAEVMRTGSGGQDYCYHLTQTGTAAIHDVGVGTLTQTDTATITIKCTATATTDNDIVQEFMRVSFIN